MNIPQNFEKIHGKRFIIGTDEYAFEKSDNYGHVWVFHKNGDNYIWPLLFEIDWKNETLSIKECAPGAGTVGEYVQTGAPLVKHMVKDMMLFINHIGSIVELLIKNKNT